MRFLHNPAAAVPPAKVRRPLMTGRWVVLTGTGQLPELHLAYEGDFCALGADTLHQLSIGIGLLLDGGRLRIGLRSTLAQGHRGATNARECRTFLWVSRPASSKSADFAEEAGEFAAQVECLCRVLHLNVSAASDFEPPLGDVSSAPYARLPVELLGSLPAEGAEALATTLRRAEASLSGEYWVWVAYRPFDLAQVDAVQRWAARKAVTPWVAAHERHQYAELSTAAEYGVVGLLDIEVSVPVAPSAAADAQVLRDALCATGYALSEVGPGGRVLKSSLSRVTVGESALRHLPCCGAA